MISAVTGALPDGCACAATAANVKHKPAAKRTRLMNGMSILPKMYDYFKLLQSTYPALQ
jgi:hypothetical protein